MKEDSPQSRIHKAQTRSGIQKTVIKEKNRLTMGVISNRKLLIYGDRTFEVSWSDAPNDPAWDAFLVSVPDGHHEQTSLWGQVRSHYGWKIARYTLREHGSIIAGAQAQLRPIGKIGRVAYITYGPCINTEEDLVVEICLTELKRFLRGLGVIYAAIGLPYNAYGIAKLMQASGFIRKPHRLHPHFLETTLVIDLKKQPEEILAGMQTSTRKHVRQALKRGITVVEGNVRDLDTFRELMYALCKRRKTTPNPPQVDFFQQLWKLFNPKDWIKLFIAMYDQEPISAVIAFQFGEWFRTWKIGWSGQYGNFRPNEAVWWSMIQYARNNGYRYFDFVEIDPVQAQAVLNGIRPEPSSANTTFFKLGFGGEIKVLPGAYCYFSNPLVRMALRGWGRKFIDSRMLHRLTQIYSKYLYRFR
jgi:lipid II:glycine glycyltransferase (peptidoglycan interpeptide bridge formation enzyme)